VVADKGEDTTALPRWQPRTRRITPTMTNAADSPAPKPEWMPRIWEGINTYAWLRLLARNRFAIEPPYWYIAAIISAVSVGHTVARFVQESVEGPRVRRTRLREAPLFILGHWRTGTTLLHEMLILDERHAFPTTYECLSPNHFLISGDVLPPLIPFLMPSRRPMDNMAAGWDRPQEDEFALCMLGAPSPYLSIAFPNNPPTDDAALDLEGLPPRELRRWKRTFARLLQELTVRHKGKRLVLKSPTHTARVRVLLELFPDARFVHIVRDPYVVFSSTVHLWKSLYETHGLQKPTFVGLEERVLATFERMYARLERDRGLVEPERFYELKYEDLVRDPVGEVRRVYERLQLGEFEPARPALEAYCAANQRYQTNRYRLTPEQKATVTRRWGEVIRRYGYTEPPG
jgi:omega-hydroxy-beta-dihydromenaquinone-9 sulfotransferase